MSEWIKCSERMPSVGEIVLASGYRWGDTNKGRWRAVAQFEGTAWFDPEEDELFNDPDLWTPIPEIEP